MDDVTERPVVTARGGRMVVGRRGRPEERRGELSARSLRIMARKDGAAIAEPAINRTLNINYAKV